MDNMVRLSRPLNQFSLIQYHLLVPEFHSHSLALNILDTLKAVSRPPIRPKRKYTHQTRHNEPDEGPVKDEVWQPAKRLKTEKRDRWRLLLQNWIAWVSEQCVYAHAGGNSDFICVLGWKAAFVQIEPFVDNSVGLFMPFYGYIKVLFLLYLLLTRPSVSHPCLIPRISTN